MIALRVFTLLLVGSATVAALGDEPAPTTAEIRASVERALPHIAEQGQWWIEEKKCVTCHRVGNMAWSLAAARHRDLAVDDRLDEWFNWSIDHVLSENDQGKLVAKGNKEGLAQLLLARPLFGDTSNRDDDFAKFDQVFLDDQQSDGSWKPCGQLPMQKRDSAETTTVSTMWIALSVADRWPQNEHRANFDLALQSVDASKPGQSTEWYAVRLLLALKVNDARTSAAMAEHLRNQQNDDGGWGWIVGQQSDALGTGLSLYALSRLTAGDPEASVIRGQRFLLNTQREDGTWEVRGTKEKKKDKTVETAAYWGATWAVLGLTSNLTD